MSTYYYIEKGKEVPFKKIQTLNTDKVKAVDCDENGKTQQVVSDGKNYLWCYANKEGCLNDLTRFGGNCVEDMIDAIEDMFNLVIIDEYDYMDKYPQTEDEEDNE